MENTGKIDWDSYYFKKIKDFVNRYCGSYSNQMGCFFNE